MRFPMEKGIKEVKRNQLVARECYMASLEGESIPRENMSIESLEVQDERVRVAAEPGGELKDIILNTDTPDRTTWVGLNLPIEFKTPLRDFLIKKLGCICLDT